jgi:hypothetical protein
VISSAQTRFIADPKTQGGVLVPLLDIGKTWIQKWPIRGFVIFKALLYLDFGPRKTWILKVQDTMDIKNPVRVLTRACPDGMVL